MIAYASLCMGIPLFKKSLKYFKKGLNLYTELEHEWGVSRTLELMGLRQGIRKDYRHWNRILTTEDMEYLIKLNKEVFEFMNYLKEM